jgi:hypothetical protein
MQRRGKLSCFSIFVGWMLPVKLDTDSVAGGTDPTARAEWRDGFADSLSEGHEEAVQLFPVSDRDDLPQSELGASGCFRSDEP